MILQLLLAGGLSVGFDALENNAAADPGSIVVQGRAVLAGARVVLAPWPVAGVDDMDLSLVVAAVSLAAYWLSGLLLVSGRVAEGASVRQGVLPTQPAREVPTTLVRDPATGLARRRVILPPH